VFVDKRKENKREKRRKEKGNRTFQLKQVGYVYLPKHVYRKEKECIQGLC